VLARPDAPAFRLLPAGVGLLRASTPVLGAAGPDSRGSMRTDAGIAVLALAGPGGMRRKDLFRAVYGFAFAYERHAGVFDVLMHRMRKRFEPYGEVRRSDDRCALVIRAPVVVPDTRSARPTEERVLWVLAARGQASAEDLAHELGASVRTVQLALQQLVADGACRSQRAGQTFTYVVDDTTFKARP
jgi:hypothetical protein